MQQAVDRRSFLAKSAATAPLAAFSRRCFGQSQNDRPASIVNGVDAREAAMVRSHVDKFMKKYHVPGLSLAMAKDGKLKLIGGFGYGNVEKKDTIRPDNVFRIASVSKPITSTTVLKLVEQGKITLRDKIFGKTGILRKYDAATRQTSAANRRRLESITVQHLLEHACGGWNNSKNDPMFAGAAISFDHDRLIRWTLKNKLLEHDPGHRYSYSNFGYCLLGRVIEQVTGKPYVKSVRELVLTPSKIKEMRIGRDTREARHANEVVYYGQNEDAYHRVMRVGRMDAHGGWVASAIDLVRFVIHVDGFRSPPDVLSASMIKSMATPSSANVNYAKGWNINRSNNWWHTGGFNGSASILARISDGHCWAVVMNTRSRDDHFYRDLDVLPWNIKKSIRSWGNHNLFG